LIISNCFHPLSGRDVAGRASSIKMWGGRWSSLTVICVAAASQLVVIQ